MFSENNMKENMTVATFLLRNLSNNIFESWLRSTDYKIAVWYPFSGRSMIFFQLAEHMKAFFRARNKTARNFDWRVGPVDFQNFFATRKLRNWSVNLASSAVLFT